MLSPTLLKKLAAIVGRDNCLTGRLDIEMYSYDSSAFIHPPEVIVLPGTVDELAQVVRLTHEHGSTLVPRGAGTSVSGGDLARHGGVMLVTTRLNRIVELDLLEESVLVECGVVNIDLEQLPGSSRLHVSSRSRQSEGFHAGRQHLRKTPAA